MSIFVFILLGLSAFLFIRHLRANQPQPVSSSSFTPQTFSETEEEEEDPAEAFLSSVRLMHRPSRSTLGSYRVHALYHSVAASGPAVQPFCHEEEEEDPAEAFLSGHKA
jgi:hypothetical protein